MEREENIRIIAKAFFKFEGSVTEAHHAPTIDPMIAIGPKIKTVFHIILLLVWCFKTAEIEKVITRNILVPKIIFTNESYSTPREG